MCETWLKSLGDDSACADLTPAGYSFKSFPRPSRGGGLAVLYKDNFVQHISFVTDFDFVHSSFELVQINLTLPEQTIRFFLVYRPPPSRKNKLTDSLFLEQLPDLLDLCNTLPGSSIVLGDVNVHYDCPQQPLTAKTLDILATFDFKQCVSEATHVKGHTIDWIAHRSDDSIVHRTVVTQAITTDHYCVMARLSARIPHLQPLVITARNIRAIDREALKADLHQRLSVLPSPSADDLDCVLRDVLDSHAPATQRRISSRRSSPWFGSVSEEVRAAKRARRRAERRWLKHGLTIHKELFNKAKRFVSELVHAAKTSFFSAKIAERPSCKQLFSVCNQLLGKNKPSLLPTNYSASELPSRFLDFFQGKISTLRANLDQQSCPAPAVTERCFRGVPFLAFHNVSEDIVKRTILHATPTTCDLDPLPTPLLIECLDVLLPSITSLINHSLSSGSFPSIFKSALVKPLLKKPSLNPNDLKNYRPVSNLSFLSKIIEKLVLSQLLEHLTSKNLLSAFQSAYRSHHSTETALLKILNDILISLDNGKVCILTLLDLSAAFDTIDHEILLTRLHTTFGISEIALSWFRSYLSDRNLTVSVNGLLSDSSTLQFGVPQGSVLGPVLFLLYMQPLFDIVRPHSVNQHAFADDNQLYKDSTLEELPRSLISMENCILDVKHWMTINKLQLNDSKTECMLIRNSRISTDLFPSSLKVGDTDVELVSTVKNLGVTLDCNLTLSAHIQNTCKTAYMQLRQISAIRHFLTQEATQTLVCAFVLSRIDYCNSLLSGCPKYLLNKLQRVQNSAARLVCKVRKSDHITPVLHSLHWLPVSARIQYKISCICFHAATGTSPQYISDLLHIYTPSRQLRSSADTRTFRIPTVKNKTLGQRSFFYQAPVTWNKLPLPVRHANSIVSFRSGLKTHLFSETYDN